MTVRSAKHATFTIERVYPAAPARVFAAWSNKEAKTAWAYCHPEWPVSDHVFDFREGGCELRPGPRLVARRPEAPGPVEDAAPREVRGVEVGEVFYEGPVIVHGAPRMPKSAVIQSDKRGRRARARPSPDGSERPGARVLGGVGRELRRRLLKLG